MTTPPGGPDRYAYPAPYYAPGWQTPRPALDGASLAAFVTGLLGLGPVPVVLGAVGLSRTRGAVRRGRVFAWVGLALGIAGVLAYTVLGVALWLLLRPLPADVAGPRVALATQVSVGNCLARLPDDGAVLLVNLVPCDWDHEALVVHKADLPDAPDAQGRLDAAAAELCRAAAPEASLVVWAPSPGRPGVTCLDRSQP